MHSNFFKSNKNPTNNEENVNPDYQIVKHTIEMPSNNQVPNRLLTMEEIIDGINQYEKLKEKLINILSFLLTQDTSNKYMKSKKLESICLAISTIDRVIKIFKDKYKKLFNQSDSSRLIPIRMIYVPQIPKQDQSQEPEKLETLKFPPIIDKGSNNSNNDQKKINRF